MPPALPGYCAVSLQIAGRLAAGIAVMSSPPSMPRVDRQSGLPFMLESATPVAWQMQCRTNRPLKPAVCRDDSWAIHSAASLLT